MNNKLWVFALFLGTSAAQAAPQKTTSSAAPAKSLAPAFVVEPKAHQIWLRAARLYAGLNALQIAWKTRSGETPKSKRAAVVSDSTVLIDYQAFLKKLRFELRQDGVQSQVVIDEKNDVAVQQRGF